MSPHRFVLDDSLRECRYREAAMEIEAVLRLDPHHAGARQALESLRQLR